MKDKIINNILNDLQNELTAKQLQAVKSSVIMALYNVNIVEKDTELSVSNCANNDDAIKLYTISLSVEQHSKYTIRQYLYAIKNLFAFIDKDFREITHEDIKYYLIYMSRKRNWKPATINNTRKYIKSFYLWALENDYIGKNPFSKIKSFKIVQSNKNILSEEDIEFLRDSTKTPIESAIIDTLNATGLRVSELCLLNRENIDIVTGKISVFAPKTQTWRTVFLDVKAKKHINDYFLTRSDNNPAAFITKNDRRIYPNQIEKLIQDISSRAKINKHITVHTFRRTLASRLFQRNVDLLTIATILGHASTSTTEKYYIKVDETGIQHKYNLVS